MLAGASLLPTAPPKAQFRAVITCGYGSDLYPLIESASTLSDEDELGGAAAPISTPAGQHHGQTKALLPVAGRRMIDWVLDAVEVAGVFGQFPSRQPLGSLTANLSHHADVLVLAPSSIAGPLASHLRARRSAPSSSANAADPSSRVELEEVPDKVARLGTVAVLQYAAKQQFVKVSQPPAPLPCDHLRSARPPSSRNMADSSLAVGCRPTSSCSRATS